jgi:hypothetical protein
MSVDPETLTKLDDVMPPMDTKPEKIYVAASVRAQGQATRLAVELQQAGFTVTGRWLTKNFATVPSRDEHWQDWIKHCLEWSSRDLEDLAAADTLIVLCDERSSSGGMDFELGWWIGAKRRNVILVGGERRNVFHWLPQMRWTIGTEGLVDWLKQWSQFGPWSRVKKEFEL